MGERFARVLSSGVRAKSDPSRALWFALGLVVGLALDWWLRTP